MKYWAWGGDNGEDKEFCERGGVLKYWAWGGGIICHACSQYKSVLQLNTRLVSVKKSKKERRNYVQGSRKKVQIKK